MLYTQRSGLPPTRHANCNEHLRGTQLCSSEAGTSAVESENTDDRAKSVALPCTMKRASLAEKASVEGVNEPGT